MDRERRGKSFHHLLRLFIDDRYVFTGTVFNEGGEEMKIAEIADYVAIAIVAALWFSLLGVLVLFFHPWRYVLGLMQAVGEGFPAHKHARDICGKEVKCLILAKLALGCSFLSA
ncbi:MAG: hypothetical protein Q8N68_02310 [bacterium]|nr:hypothetical protein [bacterium]